ncbi:hypothetical protein LWI29_021171 [Acer saccharum]|uniref:Uncharacterized protein n=1 Tax=Acer saccharum TaxID=4024 RepID=A0AA39VR46_ACESA|nr:hypothetical protein LWI29_015914 [Acer saccharum]KAK0589990.1 hypothetical protein LWI29_021171 [Acer saccharum]
MHGIHTHAAKPVLHVLLGNVVILIIDGGALGNIQQQNQPQAGTDIVQAQNATAITQDNMETTEDPMEYFSSLDSSQLDFKDLLYQNGVYKFQQGNELARVVQQFAQDGGDLGNIQQQIRPRLQPILSKLKMLLLLCRITW